MREDIELINKIIAEAVMYGADSGGSYDSNEEDLTEAITDWLKFKGIDNEYCVEYQINWESLVRVAKITHWMPLPPPPEAE